MGLRRVAKSALAGLLTVAWLFITTLAGSPALHEYFHHHAADADHSCVVTLLAQGNLLAAPGPAASVILVLLLLFCVPPAGAAEFSSVDLRLGFGRGPPVPSSHS